jgi:hypothetical protein
VGPGLWPGPRRQARWAGGSRVNGAPKARPRTSSATSSPRPPASSPAPWRPPAMVPLLATVLAKEPLPDLKRGSDLGALGGTRTPNLLIRRSGQVVQDRPSPVVGWADIPGLSMCVGRRPAAWQQCWQQSRRNGADPRPSAFQAGHMPSRYATCEGPWVLPAADARRWLLPLLSVGAHSVKAWKYQQAPSPESNGACTADQVPGLATADVLCAVGALARLALDGTVLDRVARSPAVTADRRTPLRVLQEVPHWRRLNRPQRVASPAAYVNHAVLVQDRVLHTPPRCVVGTAAPVGVRTGRSAAFRVDPIAPVRLPDMPAGAGSCQPSEGPGQLLSLVYGVCFVAARTVQGMARVRSGQAPAWPLVSDRSVRRGSRVKRDFACTFTRQFSPVLVVLRSQSGLRLEGRTRTLSGPSPDSSPARAVLSAPYGLIGSGRWAVCLAGEDRSYNAGFFYLDPD